MIIDDNEKCDILMVKMNRFDFQVLAVERLADADALFKAGRFACAYYISGYAIECALKACICRKTNKDDFPPKDASRYYVHDVQKLLENAGLGSAFEQAAGKDAILNKNWITVKDWTEETRYQVRGQEEAEWILAAINDPEHGVLQWLRRNW